MNHVHEKFVSPLVLQLVISIWRDSGVDLNPGNGDNIIKLVPSFSLIPEHGAGAPWPDRPSQLPSLEQKREKELC